LIVGVAGAILIAAQRIVVALLAAVLLVVIVTYLLYGFRLVKQLNSSECVNSKERHKLTKKASL
jgi:flagellar biogenesis protein FliO